VRRKLTLILFAMIHFAIRDWNAAAGTGNDPRVLQGARSFFYERILDRRRGNDKGLAESFVVRLSIRLVKSRHLHFRARAGVPFSDGDWIERCCVLAALSFSLLSRTPSWHLLCWRPVDDHLRTTMTTTRKEDCLQNCIGGGRGEEEEPHRLEERKSNETLSLSSLVFCLILFAWRFDCESSCKGSLFARKCGERSTELTRTT